MNLPPAPNGDDERPSVLFTDNLIGYGLSVGCADTSSAQNIRPTQMVLPVEQSPATLLLVSCWFISFHGIICFLSAHTGTYPLSCKDQDR